MDKSKIFYCMDTPHNLGDGHWDYFYLLATSFHVLIGHLYIFGEMFIQIHAHFLCRLSFTVEL